MKSKLLNWVLPIITVFLFTVLAIPVRLRAQEQRSKADNVKHHHYKLIDMGTFGGPQALSIPKTPT